MSSFSDTFDNETRPLTTDLIPNGSAEIEKLDDAGFEVHAGLTPEYAEQIMKMAFEPAIRQYCPKDCTQRFKDFESIEHWLSKKRGTFLLLKRLEDGSRQVAGYGWVGESQSDYGETTFSIRVGEIGQGQGLATPFARLIVLGAAKLYGARKIWLETWQSNAAAVHVYHKIGFIDINSHEGSRLEPDGTSVPDTRLYMSLDDSLLN